MSHISLKRKRSSDDELIESRRRLPAPLFRKLPPWRKSSFTRLPDEILEAICYHLYRDEKYKITLLPWSGKLKINSLRSTSRSPLGLTFTSRHFTRVARASLFKHATFVFSSYKTVVRAAESKGLVNEMSNIVVTGEKDLIRSRFKNSWGQLGDALGAFQFARTIDLVMTTYLGPEPNPLRGLEYLGSLPTCFQARRLKNRYDKPCLITVKIPCRDVNKGQKTFDDAHNWGLLKDPDGKSIPDWTNASLAVEATEGFFLP
ncbi:Actin-like protein arp6 [Sphaceloma murrayae]|uniref:Actin-like protein arp6 n=1 Tax=Sphaceloma murrayae TaxID=2082308 RepID=A0A2K1QK80_9PEZI|nr:Actin-like protein arp6 [Sphaceloma murrayae]